MNLDNAQNAIVGVLTAIIGVAIVAILISRNAKTTEVLGAAASGFGQILTVAVSPVTGGNPFAGSGAAGSQVFSPGGGGGINIPGTIQNLSGAIQQIGGLFN